jgi:hypothetical protein
MAAKSWRDVIKVHPAAELFPAPTGVDQEEFEKDIAAHGIRVPVVFWRETNKDPRFLIDGIQRLTTAEKVGRFDPNDLPFDLKTGGDPYALALSLNTHRRHLTRAQKDQLIDKLLSARPDLSDRQIGEGAKVDHKTVANRRKKKERRGEIPHVGKRADTKGRKQPASKSKRRRRQLQPQSDPTVNGLGTDRPPIDVSPQDASAPSVTPTPRADPALDEHAKRCAELDEIARSGDPRPPEMPPPPEAPMIAKGQAELDQIAADDPPRPGDAPNLFTVPPSQLSSVDEGRLRSFNEALAGLAGQYRDVVRVQQTAQGQWLIELIETIH